MINLLPPERKKQLRAARSNRQILRYIVLTVAAIVFLIGAMALTYFFLVMSAGQADERKAANEAQASEYASVQQEASQLRTGLSSAKQIFSEEYRYSLALARIGNTLPSGTALQSLDLSAESFQGTATFTVLISGEAAATSLRTSFTDSQYFSNVSFGNLAINDGNSSYPYSIEMSVQMNRSIAQ